MIRNELNIFSLNNRINYIHHIERKKAERNQKLLMDYTSRETRSSGHPKLRWTDQRILQKNGSKGANLSAEAADDSTDIQTNTFKNRACLSQL
jgi:hypothetical protein